MLTAQLDCNPLYPTAWQNDRNITNQKRDGGRSRRGGGGGAGGRSRSLSSAPRPSPSSRPGEGRAGRKAPFAAVTAPPEDRRGGRSCYFRKGSRRRGGTALDETGRCEWPGGSRAHAPPSRRAPSFPDARPGLAAASLLAAFHVTRPRGDQLLGTIFLHAVDGGDRLNSVT